MAISHVCEKRSIVITNHSLAEFCNARFQIYIMGNHKIFAHVTYVVFQRGSVYQKR